MSSFSVAMMAAPSLRSGHALSRGKVGRATEPPCECAGVSALSGNDRCRAARLFGLVLTTTRCRPAGRDVSERPPDTSHSALVAQALHHARRQRWAALACEHLAPDSGPQASSPVLCRRSALDPCGSCLLLSLSATPRHPPGAPLLRCRSCTCPSLPASVTPACCRATMWQATP